MQRGVITLSNLEQNLVYQYLSASAVALPVTVNKFVNTNEDKIELSKEETEQILDSLPIPSSENPPEINQLRTKITTFYQSLR